MKLLSANNPVSKGFKTLCFLCETEKQVSSFSCLGDKNIQCSLWWMTVKQMEAGSLLFSSLVFMCPVTVRWMQISVWRAPTRFCHYLHQILRLRSLSRRKMKKWVSKTWLCDSVIYLRCWIIHYSRCYITKTLMWIDDPYVLLCKLSFMLLLLPCLCLVFIWCVCSWGGCSRCSRRCSSRCMNRNCDSPLPQHLCPFISLFRWQWSLTDAMFLGVEMKNSSVSVFHPIL